MAEYLDFWRSGGTGIGAYIFKANSASTVPLILQGYVGQTANILEIKNSTGTVLFSVDPSGNVTYLGDEYVTDQLKVNGNAIVSGTLGVTGATTLSSTLSVSGLVTMNNGLTVDGNTVFGDETTIHSLTVEGELVLNSGYIRSNFSANLHLLPAPSTITIVGDAGTTSNTLNSNDDLLVTGKLEVDGMLYGDAGITVASLGTATAGVTTYTSNYIYLHGSGWDTDDLVARATTAKIYWGATTSSSPGGVFYLDWLSNGVSQGNIYSVNTGGTMTLQGNLYAQGGLLSTAATNRTITVKGNANDAGTGVILDNGVTFTSGTLVSVRNNNTEKFLVNYLGNISSVGGLFTMTGGTAITAGSYQMGRNADATNLMNFNVPTGASYEFGVNDVAEMILSSTAVNFQDNSITTTGGGSLTGTWTDMGSVTTIDINGGTIDGVTIGGAAAGAGTFTSIVGTDLDLTLATSTVAVIDGATTAHAASTDVVQINGTWGNVNTGNAGVLKTTLTSGGMTTAGNSIFGNGSVVVTNASDAANTVMMGYNAAVTDNGGSQTTIAYGGLSGFDRTLAVIGGAINIGPMNQGATAGNDVNIFGSAATGAGPANGGVVNIYGGLKAGAGNDGYVKIGQAAGTPGTMTATDDDLYVKGQVETDGMIYADGGVTGALTGNASTATALQNTRTIWGQNFDGSANVTGALSGATTIALSQGITQTPTITGTLFDMVLETEWTNGTLINADFGSATVQDGDMFGTVFNFNANLAGVTDKDVTGHIVSLPALTQSTANTTTYIGWSLATAGALVQDTAAGTINWKGINIQMPNTTATTGTVTSHGISITGGTITSGTEAGVYVNMASGADSAINVAAGTTYLNGSVGIIQNPVASVALTSGWSGAMVPATTAARHGWFTGNITELANAAITDIVGVYINNFTVTDGGGTETVGILAGLYIPDAPVAGTTPTNGPYSIFVDAGATRLDGNLSVGGANFRGMVVTGAADYAPSALTDDYIISMSNTAAPRAVTISTEDVATGSATLPRIFVIKDSSGGAGTNNITVTLESGGTIDGAASYVMSVNYESITLYIDGTNAFII